MTVLYPEATQVYGNTSALVVQTMAAPSAPDLSTDIQAVTTVNVSCFLYSRRSGNLDHQQG